MHKKALRNAQDEFDAMKRQQGKLETATHALEVRDSWKFIVTANYEISEKLKHAFDKNSPMEMEYFRKFKEQQKKDELLRYVFLSRKVGCHDTESIARVDGAYLEIEANVLVDYSNLPEPRPDFKQFVLQHPNVKTTQVAVLLPRFKHIDHGRDLGWVNTPAEHLGGLIVTEMAGFTPVLATHYLVRYYEIVFRQLAEFL